VKDLSKLNRDLSKVALVDNSAYSYAMQLDNGVPILPFYEGKDFELTALEHYIQKLSDCSDVRVMNREYFQLYRYTSFENSNSLVNELYAGTL
jgi:CTD small phosphatase-like protein 2